MRPLALALIAGVLASAPGAQPTPPPITPLRSGESYAYLAGRDTLAARERTAADALKYVPLGGAVWGGGASFLTLAGEVRLRPEAVRNAAAVAGRDDGSVLWRAAASADVRLGHRLRVFGQLYAATRTGAAFSDPVSRDDLSVHEAFAEAVVLDRPGARVTLNAGRQEHPLGSGRLIGLREGPNVRLSFDAARVLVDLGRPGAQTSVDAFVQRTVEVAPGAFDDGTVEGEATWGAYATRPLGRGGVVLDGYYLGHDEDAAFGLRGPAPTTRHTVGVRLSTRPGAGPWEVDAEAAVQVGRTGGGGAPEGDVRAYLFGGGVAWTAAGVPLRPQLGLLLDVASGDHDAADPDAQGFVAPEPNNSYFGLAGVVGGFRNMVSLKPRLVLTADVLSGLTVTGSWSAYWRESRGDAAYGPSTRPVFPAPPPPGSPPTTAAPLPAERFVGHQPLVEATLQLTRYLGVTAHWERFEPGAFARAAAPGAEAQTFWALQVLARF